MDHGEDKTATLRIPGGRLEGDSVQSVLQAGLDHADYLEITSESALVAHGAAEALSEVWAPVGSQHVILATPRAPEAVATARSLAHEMARLTYPTRRHVLVDVDGALMDQPQHVTVDVSEDPVATARALVDSEASLRRVVPEPTIPEVGWLPNADGSVDLAGVSLDGTLQRRLVEALVALGQPVTFTPWRTVIVHDLSEDDADVVVRVLAQLGLVYDERAL